jgi:hypothetical protein
MHFWVEVGVAGDEEVAVSGEDADRFDSNEAWWRMQG